MHFLTKLVQGNAEGGANVFHLDYFAKKASLAQSPQLYKQMMVGVYERVFEIGHVYRAEPHNTSRHLNEYVSMDLEMGFIESFHEIMEMEAKCLAYMINRTRELCHEALFSLGVTLPEIKEIPVLHLQEACELIGKISGKNFKEEGSLSATGEKLLSEAVLKQYGSDFVFVTHYTTRERPFYAKEDPARPGEILSFDLIFRGLEITTGGQRINDYEELVAKMTSWGLDLESFRHYLMAFEAGLPTHGGLGLGLERLTALLTGTANVKEASLFPQDMLRLSP